MKSSADKSNDATPRVQPPWTKEMPSGAILV